MVERKPYPPPMSKRVPKIYGQIPVRYNSHLSQELARHEGQIPSTSSSESESDEDPLRSVGRSFAAMAVFVVFIIIMVNFIVIFPAIGIVTPELVSEHQAEMQTAIPFEVDPTDPLISEVTISTSYNDYQFTSLTNLTMVEVEQGEIFKITVDASDNNLAVVTADLSAKTNILKYQTILGIYQSALVAPVTPGSYELELSAMDYGDNTAKIVVPLRVISTTKPVIYLTGYGAEFTIRNGALLKINVQHNNPYQLEYRRSDPELRLTSNALRTPYLISTSGWVEGIHIVEIIATDDLGVSNSVNYTITVDNDSPVVSDIEITPLTPDRQDVFGLKLPENNYYRGEIVKISARVSDPHIQSVMMQLITDRKFPADDGGDAQRIKTIAELKYNPGSYEFELIISLPTRAAKYEFNLTACDSANNTCASEKKEIAVAEITYEGLYVPIIKLQTPITSGVISNDTILKFSTNYGDIDELSYTFTNGTTPLTPGTSFHASELEPGNYTLNLHSTRSSDFYDILFITLPLPPFIFGLFLIEGLGLVVYYFFIASVIILSSITLLLKNGKGYINQLSKFIFTLEPPSLKTDNAIVLIAQFFLAILFLNVLYSLILSLFAITPHTPAFGEQPTWMLLYNLSSASAWEEIISRTLLIGVPLLFFDSIMDHKEKPGWKYLIGGDFKLNPIPIILIVFSALVFGFAHAPGWDYWKVFTSTVSGMAFGYLFLRKGLYASVILHFTINYLTMPLQVAGNPPALVQIFDVVLFLLIFIGAILFFYYIIRIYKFFVGELEAAEADVS